MIAVDNTTCNNIIGLVASSFGIYFHCLFLFTIVIVGSVYAGNIIEKGNGSFLGISQSAVSAIQNGNIIDILDCCHDIELGKKGAVLKIAIRTEPDYFQGHPDKFFIAGFLILFFKVRQEAFHYVISYLRSTNFSLENKL